MPGQVWSVSADGGFLYSDQLSDYMRMVLLPTVKYRQFCDADDHTDKGLHRGEAFTWNIYSMLATGGGELSEHQPIPTDKLTVTQGSGTITEYGVQVPYTGKLDDLALHPVKTIINKVLKIDATKALDAAAYAQFDATPRYVVGTDGTTVSFETTLASNNGSALKKAHWKQITDEMKESDIPGYFDNGDYGVIARPATFRSIKDELEAIHQYVDPGFQMIMNGEMGRYEGVRAFEQTNRAAEASGLWDAGSNVSDAAHFFGADTVHEAIAIPEEIRAKVGNDYGRDKGVAWYALLGYKIVHSVAAQARIIKWASTT